MKSTIGRIAILFGCALASPAFAASFITFSVPGAGGTRPVAINTNGDVAGCYTPANSGNCIGVFLRTYDGTITTFQVGTDCCDYPSSINDQDTIAGTFNVCPEEGGCYGEAFVRTADGTITTFNPPGAQETWSAFVGNNGIVGGSFPSSSGTMGYIRSADGTFTTFPLPAGASVSVMNSNGDLAGKLGDAGLFVQEIDGTVLTAQYYPLGSGYVTGVNDSDEVVGMSIYYPPGYPPGLYFAFLWEDPNSVEPLAAPLLYPSGINDAGDIVGSVGQIGFVRSSNGQITRFEVQSTPTAPTAINDNGVITGYIGNFSIGPQGFLRLP
jgi:hypothetical protein